MKRWEQEYDRWRERVTDGELSAELREIAGAEAEIEDRFYRDLTFGTGGLRGILGAGSNRMNIHVVARATQGLCRYLQETGGVREAAVSYDSRLKSRLFAETAAGVFAANGILVHMYPQLMPTPCLSFAVRRFGCGIGVMITASHNPAAYNGYKVYGADGCQITSRAAEEIWQRIGETDLFDGVRALPFPECVERGLVQYIGEETVEEYLAMVARASLLGAETARDFTVVYTPLNGTGICCVPTCLRRAGFTDVRIPAAQREPDGRFPTCPRPNPEIREALSVALDFARQEGAELVLATDPDCDRVGVAVRSGEDYTLLNGNQTGVLLLDFLCRMRAQRGAMPAAPLAVKTIVTTPMAAAVAAEYGVEIADTLTGFKYIGELIGALEARGEEERFLFGFEESYGYLSITGVRDKDAVNASLLICEMFAWYRARGVTLPEALEKLSERCGWYAEETLTFAFPGSAGAEAMGKKTAALRAAPPTEIAGFPVERMQDYLAADTGLPAADVLQFSLGGGALATVRPSGTEPQLKVYLSARGASRGESRERLERLKGAFSRWADEQD